MADQTAGLASGLGENVASSFLDLPAEIRDQIYRDAVVFESSQYYGIKSCSPALLATCKQVRYEAEDILYSQNEVINRLATSVDSEVTLTANGRDIRHKKLDREVQLPYPKYLFRVRKIRMGCSFNHRSHESIPPVMYTVNDILYGLHQFLLGNPHVERIRIDITNNSTSIGQHLKDTLSPLSLFRQRAQLHFQGASSSIARCLLEDSLQTHPNDHLDVFGTLLKLQSKAEDYVALFDGKIRTPLAVSSVKNALKGIERNLRSTERMMTLSKDRQLKQSLHSLEEALSCVDSNDINFRTKRLNAKYLQSLKHLMHKRVLSRYGSSSTQPQSKSVETSTTK